MVIFTSRLFDVTYSPLILHEDRSSNLRGVERRVSRTKTLDGEVRIDDAGYSDGDRTISLRVRAPSKAQVAALQGLVAADGLQRLSTVDGLMEGAVEYVALNDGLLNVRFLVRDRIDA